MTNLIMTITVFVLFLSCSQVIEDSFNSSELISSKGEKIYINSLNWGISNDYQITAISSKKDKVQERSDTEDIINGLEPFFYSFKNDSLTLFFKDTVTYKVNENFKTIIISYKTLNSDQYNGIRQKAYMNDGYRSIPERREVAYPDNMPKPPLTE